MKLTRVYGACAVALLVFSALTIFYVIRDDEKPMDPEAFFRSRRTVVRPPETFDPIEDCITPFGKLLGIANRTPAYSNCASTFRSKKVNYFNYDDPMDVTDPLDHTRTNKVMVATQWIAIDFVMRWMALNKGVMPLFVEEVDAMWQRNYFYNPQKVQQEWAGEYIANYHDADTPDAIAYTRPRVGDIILYNSDASLGFPNGHVAVIVAVKNDIEGAGGVERYKALAARGTVPRILYLAEQNYDNKPWANEGYSRVAYFKWREPVREGLHPEGYIEDDSGLTVLGRMRVGAPRLSPAHVDRYQEGVNADEEEDL